MGRWRLFARFGDDGPPYVRQFERDEDGVIGRRYFEEYAERHEATRQVLFRLDKVYDDWTEGPAIEVHCPDPDGTWQSATDEELLAAVYDDLAALPQPVGAADVEHFAVHRWGDLFSLYTPGTSHCRPGTTTGVSGLLLAGDWTWNPDNHWHMEHAVASGFLAASAVLEASGLAPHDLHPRGRDRWPRRLTRGLARFLRRFVPLR